MPTLELDISNITFCLGNFYQGLLGCEFAMCRHNEALGAWSLSPYPGWTNELLLAGHRRRWDILQLLIMELQEPTGSDDGQLPHPTSPT